MITQLLRRDLQWPLYRIASSWGWLLALGIVSLFAGLAAILMEHQTLVVIAKLFVAMLIAGGLFRFVGALGVPRDSGWLRPLMAVQALIGVLAGVFLLQDRPLTIFAFTLVLGIYWVVHGAIEVYDSIGDPAMRGRGWMIAGGLLSLIAGGLVLFASHIPLVTLTLVLGGWLIIYGVVLLVTAMMVRAATRGLQGASFTAQPFSKQPP